MKDEKTFEFSNLIWLHCDLQLRGKAIVRHGKRKEVASGKKWVFCPLQHFPRDRVSIDICSKCSHFKGYSKIKVNNGQTTSEYVGKSFKWESDDKGKTTMTGEDVEMAIKKLEDERRKWKKDEESI